MNPPLHDVRHSIRPLSVFSFCGQPMAALRDEYQLTTKDLQPCPECKRARTDPDLAASVGQPVRACQRAGQRPGQCEQRGRYCRRCRQECRARQRQSRSVGRFGNIAALAGFRCSAAAGLHGSSRRVRIYGAAACGYNAPYGCSGALAIRTILRLRPPHSEGRPVPAVLQPALAFPEALRRAQRARPRAGRACL